MSTKNFIFLNYNFSNANYTRFRYNHFGNKKNKRSNEQLEIWFMEEVF